MHDNEIADRVEKSQPSADWLASMRVKEASILQRHGRMRGDRPQQIAIVL